MTKHALYKKKIPLGDGNLLDDLLEFRGIAIWNKVSLLLHNFYHQPKQVVGVKGVLR